MCVSANNNLHFIDLFARQITTHNGRYLREDFSTLHHIVIACESTMKRLTTLLFADKQLLTFPNPQKRREIYGVRGGIEEVRVAPFTRGGGHPPRAFTKGYIYMWRRARRRAIVGISLSPGLLPSARASVQRERRMSVTYREGAIDSKRAHVQRLLIIVPRGEGGQR